MAALGMLTYSSTACAADESCHGHGPPSAKVCMTVRTPYVMNLNRTLHGLAG